MDPGVHTHRRKQKKVAAEKSGLSTTDSKSRVREIFAAYCD